VAYAEVNYQPGSRSNPRGEPEVCVAIWADPGQDLREVVGRFLGIPRRRVLTELRRLDREGKILRGDPDKKVKRLTRYLRVDGFRKPQVAYLLRGSLAEWDSYRAPPEKLKPGEQPKGRLIRSRR
jgi:hypothetical protein